MTIIELMLALLISSIILIPVMAWSVMAIMAAGDDSVTSGTRTTALLNRYLKADVASSSIGLETDPLGTHMCTPALVSEGGDPAEVVLWLLNADQTTLTTYVLVGTDDVDGDTGDPISQLIRRQCPYDKLTQTGGARSDSAVVADYIIPDHTVVGVDGPPVFVSCAPREGNDDTEDSCGEVTMTLTTPTGPAVVKASRRIDPPLDWDSSRRPIAVIKCDPARPANGTRRFTVAFNSMSSYDPDGINSVAWDFGDGNTSSERNPVHVYTDIGTGTVKTFNVKLTVVNELGTFSIVRTTVTVRNARPVAVATPASVITNRIDYVPFDGSGSVDPDEGETAGTITYHWNFGDGTTSNEVKPLNGHRYTTLGTYSASFTMTDANGESSSVTIPVTVKNKPPIACFSTNQTAPPAASPNPGTCLLNPIPIPKEIRTDVYPITVTFDSNTVGAPESRDDDGFIAARIWKIGTGSSAPTQRGTGNSLTQSFTFGLHTVILEVVDNDGARSSYAVQVNVNQKPIGVIGALPGGPDGSGGPPTDPGGTPTDPATCRFNFRPATCHFTASASSDGDGTVIGWLWDFDDGTTSTEMAPSHVWTEYGTYDVTLVVTDDVGSESVPVHLTVKVNEAPTPRIGPASLNAKRKLDFQFSSDTSVDDLTERNTVWPFPHRGVPDGAIVSYEWNFGDATALPGTNNSNLMNPTHSYQSLGTKTVTLKACDNDGLCTTTTRSVSVTNQKPVAVIGGFSNNTVQGLTGDFTSTGSSDPDGTIVSYFWEFGDGTTSTAANPSHTYPSYGNKTLRLTVTDNDGATDTQQKSIYVNSLPFASFVTNRPFSYFTSTIPLHLDLDGSASWDADGSIVGYDWNFNPPIAPYGTPGPLATVDYDLEIHRGPQFITLTVTDDRGGTGQSVHHVATINQRPVAYISASPCSTTPIGGCVLNNSPFSLNFSSAGTNDPDGTISGYAWDFNTDGTIDSTAANPSHTFPASPLTSHTVTLRVTDNNGLTGTKDYIVRLNQAPTAVIKAPNGSTSGTIPLRRGISYQMDASMSTDPDALNQPAPAGPMTYLWNFGDGTATSTAQKPNHVWTTIGSFTLTLTVTDGDGKSTTTTRQVDTTNVPPTPSFTINGSSLNPYKCNASSPFTTCNAGPAFVANVNGAGSTDVDGSISNYSWDWGDGSPATSGASATASHTYTAYGVYSLILTVTDNGGATTPLTRTVKINQPPVVSISPLDSTHSTPQDVTFTATATDADNGLPGAFVPLPNSAYVWRLDGSINNGGAGTKTFSTAAMTPGIHTIQVTVTDADGAATSASTTVRINRPPVAVISAPTAGSGQRIMNTEPYTVTFVSVGTNDPDGTISSYLWDFGDGTTSTAVTPPAKVYASPGTYTVSLTVTDNEGIQSVSNPGNPGNTFTVKANAAPTALIGPSVLDPKRNLAFTFDGTGSTDPDGTIPNTATGYIWTFAGSPTIDYTNRSKPRVTWAANGTYNVTLQVRDNDLRLSPIVSRTVTVVDNVAPTASFTTDPSPASGAADPLTIAVNGSASNDPDGSIASWAWNFGDGATATGVTASHDYVGYGVFTLTLTVTDNSGQTATTTRSVRHNRRPVITVVTSPSPPVFNDPPWVVFFDATGSIDPDGTIASYSWDFDDGSAIETGPGVSHTFTARGTYDVVVTVTDNEGGVATKTVPVKVNQQPTAVATFTPPDVPLLPVNFDGLGSYDLDGSIVLWEWDFGDGSTDAGPTVEHTFIGLDSNPGTPAIDPYQVTLTVTDDDGGVDSVTIPVQTSNQMPVAIILSNPSPPIGEPAMSVAFDGAASYDPDGTLVSYSWNFGDGSPAATGYQPPAHVFPTAYGTYQVTLTITDNNGAEAIATMPVKVNRPPSGTIAPASPTRGIPFGFTGTGTDLDGSVVAYRWDFNDGPLAISTAQNPTYTYQSYGPKAVTLTITDNDGRSTIVTRNITVAQRPPVAAFAVVSNTSTPAVLSGAAPLGITVDGSGSSDPDNGLDSNPGQVIANYSYDWGDGSAATSGTSATATHSYTGGFVGTRVLTLTVTDTDGGTATFTRNIQITGNSSPNASFTRSPSSGSSPLSVFFDGSASSDSGGHIVSYSWNFGDGSATATGATTSHTYSAGQWVATLTVTDNSGATNSTTRTIAAGGQPPVPTGLRHTGGSADFAWDPVPGATKYTIIINDQGSNSVGGAFCGNQSHQFDVSPGTASTGYRDICDGRDFDVSISAWNGAENGPYSPVIRINT